MSTTTRTALVTGATSGLGYEAAIQLAESGYTTVTITGRTAEKAESARRTLVEQTGRDVFATLVIDLGLAESVSDAVGVLAGRGQSFDLLLLNAGMVAGNELLRTADGVEMTTASSLIGHHRLTMGLLGNGLLDDNAHIIIAGSEAARGDVPTFRPTNLAALAEKDFGGDAVAAAEALMRWDVPLKYKPATAYANAKLFVAYWVAELARRLPDGMTVNAVSPGSAPDTNAARNANFFMRNVMLPFFKLVPGKAAPVSEAAARYVEVAGYTDGTTGVFFASAPKKMTGPLHAVDYPHFHERPSQESVWNATVDVSGGVDYPVTA